MSRTSATCTTEISAGARVPLSGVAARRQHPLRRRALHSTASRRRDFGTQWKYLDDIRPFIKVPMLLKGILTAEDARICVERGYDGIIVSNHGGRSMDYGPAPLEVLPEIVDAVGGKIPVIVDSGFRRGSDVVKAMAIGAKAVCLGRAPRWGLGAFGPQGVQRLLEIVQQEFVEAMARTGRASLAALDRTAVRINF